jgi:hypothetical protein
LILLPAASEQLTVEQLLKEGDHQHMNMCCCITNAMQLHFPSQQIHVHLASCLAWLWWLQEQASGDEDYGSSRGRRRGRKESFDEDFAEEDMMEEEDEEEEDADAALARQLNEELNGLRTRRPRSQRVSRGCRGTSSRTGRLCSGPLIAAAQHARDLGVDALACWRVRSCNGSMCGYNGDVFDAQEG